MPGVAHQDTIRRIHSASFMEDPGAVNCRVAGNPLHEEQIEVVDMLGGALCFNTVITEQRELSFVNFGEIQESHLEGVAFVRPYAEAYLDSAFGTVLTSSAGYPLDRTYYQTVKGMVGAMEILEPGGDIFIVSEIGEGFGSADYVEAQKRLVELGIDGFLRDIEPKRMADVDEWQTEEQLKPMRKGTVHLYTQGLSREEAKLAGVEVITDLDALQRAVAASARKGGRLAVIPEGPYVLPFVRGRC
jgi:nickel-dependent lactate racemase